MPLFSSCTQKIGGGAAPLAHGGSGEPAGVAAHHDVDLDAAHGAQVAVVAFTAEKRTRGQARTRRAHTHNNTVAQRTRISSIPRLTDLKSRESGSKQTRVAAWQAMAARTLEGVCNEARGAGEARAVIGHAQVIVDGLRAARAAAAQCQ